MKTQLIRFIQYSIIANLTCFNLVTASSPPSGQNGVHFCGVTEHQPDNRRYARSLANLDVGEPRTVRMIYFLPNDWPFRADVAQKMKDTIHTVQMFYVDQMGANEYGNKTFRFETDHQGEPMVHRVDGQHPFSHYDNTLGYAVLNELELDFDLYANIYFIVLGTDALRQGDGQSAGGVGGRRSKNGGYALVPNEFDWITVAHELGHGFGLDHDFRDDAYLMSYGPGPNRLSACSAEFLSMQPYFNPDIPFEVGEPPSIKLVSPRRYPSGSSSIPLRLKVSDSAGLHQVLLVARGGLRACRGLGGERDTLVEFDYDGSYSLEGFVSLANSGTNPIAVYAVDTDGNVGETFFGLAEMSPGYIATLEGHTDRVLSVSFSTDRRTLASGSRDSTIKLWDVTTQQTIDTLEGHAAGVGSVSFSPDGRTLASGSWDGTVKLWDVTTRQTIDTLEGHTSGVGSVSFSPDGRTLASGSWDGTVKLWDVTTRQSIVTLWHATPVGSVSFSLDGGTLASGSSDGTVKLWDVTTRQDIATLEGHTSGVGSVSFSPDGRTLASGSLDGTVKLWDVTTQQDIATLEGHTDYVLSVSFSLDGGILASAGSYDGTVKLWDVATGVNFTTLWHIDAVDSVSFSLNEGTLASGTWTGTIELWDTSEWMQLRLEAVAEVDIPDPNLRTAIATTLGKLPSDPILQGSMAHLTSLEAWEADIIHLTGLEGATNLTKLDLGLNSISDISAVSGLTNLTSLILWGNNISDISAVSGLTKLTGLFLENNNISDISAVSGLTKLTSLGLWGNNISDISAVSGLTKLTGLFLENNNISDISVLSGLTNLTKLGLWGNDISDISALTGLTNLTSLILWDNNVSDISAVSGLTNLTSLHFENNNISDISAVSGLTNLTKLGGGNNVSDISAVSGLTKLTSLILWDNNVSDISAVSGLTNLTSLHFENNNISDISPLVANAGLGNGDEVYVEGNPLSYLSIHTHIPTLQSRGVTVVFHNQAHPAVLKISGDNQKGVTGAALEAPFVVEVEDANGSALVGVPVVFTVTAGGGTLNTTRTTTNANGRAQSTLKLGPHPGTNTVTVSAQGIQGQQMFSAEGIRIPKTLDIISGNDQQGLPSEALENPFVVEVRDRFDKPLPDVEVVFFVSSGGATLSVTSTTTNTNGRAESRLTLGPNPGRNTVTVSVTGVQEQQTFTSEGIRTPKTLEIISGDNQEGLPGAALEKPFIVEVRDQTDKPLAGVQVTFSVTSGGGTLSATSVTTDASGRAESRLTLGPNPGTNTVSVSVAGIQAQQTFNAEGIRIPLAFWIISGDKQQGLPGEALAKPFVVEVRDQSGDPLLGVQVTFSVTSGGGTLSVTSTTTDSDGRAESTFTLGLNPGRNTVTVSVAGIEEQQTFTAEGIRIPKTLEIVSGGDQEGLPGAALENPFVVEVRDQADKPLPDVEVSFSVSSGGGTLSATSVTTNSNGRAESTLTLGPNPGTNNVTVSVTGIEEIQTFTAEGIRIPKILEIIAGNDQEGPPGAALENPFVVEVRDQADKPLPDVEVSFSVSSGGGTLSATSVTTNSNGRAESTLTLGPEPGTNSVTVSVTGIQDEQTFNAEGMRIPKTLAIVSGNDQEGLTGTALENAFVVEVRDQFDNPLPEIQVTFTVSSGGGTLSATIVTTDSNGRAESVLTLGPNVGTNTVTVSVTGIQEQQTFTAEGVRIPLAFWITSGDKQRGLIGEALPKPIVVEVRDQSGEPLPGAQVTFSVSSGGGALSATIVATDANGRAESTLTLGPNPGTSTVAVSVTGIRETQTVTAIAELPPIPQDVNRDDVVNILDLVLVASALGDEGQSLVADVNADGIVNILDLVSVAGALGDVAAAPSIDPQALVMLTATDVGQWLVQAQGLDLVDATAQRGVLFLEQLLAVLTPKETALLPNYPNPFNPETWIPYQLANDTDVRISIYDINGALVRQLDLGYQRAGYYTDRSRAAYWDGRNAFGEPVASGIYFYLLTARDFSATRKMLIGK